MKSRTRVSGLREKVLLIGGAGYIGRHIAFELLDANFDVVILDNLSSGSLEYLPECEFFEADILTIDFHRLKHLIGKVSAVIHLAALTDAAESVLHPSIYYRINVCGTVRATELAKYLDSKVFLLSSTAAVYGDPLRLPIDEEHPLRPINPYGSSKLAAEEVVRQFGALRDIKIGIVRYFNVAGADPNGRTGDLRKKGENVVHKLLDLVDQDGVFEIFGSDFSTPDGSATRDYVHVSDIARAHIYVMSALGTDAAKDIIVNVGYGVPVSVRELVDSFRKLVGARFIARVEVKGRRVGDVGESVADNSRILGLGWRPLYAGTEFILKTALGWKDYLAGGGRAGRNAPVSEGERG